MTDDDVTRFAGLRQARRDAEVVPLGLLAAGVTTPVHVGRRVHLSVGLAGTEAILLRTIADRFGETDTASDVGGYA